MNNIIIDGRSLTIKDVAAIANGNSRVEISADSLSALERSNQYVHKIVDSDKAVYGINTGFGALSSVHIAKEDLSELQVNLIRSHCTGVGQPFSKEVTRAIMLLRANCLCSGYSGVTPAAVELLVDFINNDIIPIVPSKGSVGASGDLAPLSHIALCLIGEGEVEFEGKTVRSHFAIDQIKRKPVELGPKDGLALINGTAVMVALGSLAINKTNNLAKLADLCAAMTCDGVKGTLKAYDPRIQNLKPHPGQIASADNLRLLLKDSAIYNDHTDCDKVQDPYSLRCVPQVHGACRQTLRHCEEVFNIELNAVTDNPLIFIEDDDVISGGNFHGEALALAMDYLAMGVSELCSISERRIEKMMNPTFSGLPAFLTPESGLHSGLMIAHVTAAALTSENKYMCHPASVDSIPTSTDKEDHVSMGVTSGRKLLEIIENAEHCFAIELLCASQALDFQKPLLSSKPLNTALKLIRNHVPFIDKDRVFQYDINNLAKIIRNNELISTVEKVTGELK
jgi:histidine ammonia-lyase